MPPVDLQGLIILLLAIAPGYIAIMFWGRLRTWQGFAGDLDTVLKSLVASLLVQVLMFPLAIRLGIYPVPKHLAGYTVSILVWLLLTVVVVPAVGGVVLARIQDSTGIFANLAPAAWDRFFLESIPDGSWIVIRFNDGTYAGGTWDTESYVFTSPHWPGLFLDKEWEVTVDGYLVRGLPNTGGVLIQDASTTREIRVSVSQATR